VDYNVSGGIGELNISQNSGSVHIGHSQNDWNLHFSKDTPLELRIDMGAGQGNLHFRDIPLTQLDLNLGAGQMDIDFTGDRKADLTAVIEGGVGQANIRLPKNVGVIATASGGIGSIRVRGLTKDGDSYTNEAYRKTPATIHLKVEGGIGEIALTEEP
jgi:predicted membrane protein